MCHCITKLYASLRAEYMLDVIGAGATAVCTTDWHRIWKDSTEAGKLDLEIERIHQEGRSWPVVSITAHSEFAPSSWIKQLALLIHRGFVCNWRNTAYIYAKLIVCAIAGLVIGFTFFGVTNSVQGCQDKSFVRAFGVVIPSLRNWLRLFSCSHSSSWWRSAHHWHSSRR